MACPMRPSLSTAESRRKLSVAFYSRVKDDPALRRFFPGKTLHCAIEELTAFLTQFFGGPAEDSQRRWWLSLRESHARFAIGPAERAAWMKIMRLALDESGLEGSARAALESFFSQSSAYVVNRGTCTGGKNALTPDIESRWESQLALDEAVTAVRMGDADLAISIAEGEPLRRRLERDPATLSGLLAAMMASGEERLARYCEERIRADSSLIGQRYAGRSLLHNASARGNLSLVQLLLSMGADPDVRDEGLHTALYSVANEYPGDGREIVQALIKAGAAVDANEGAKRCSALHMAARRGNVSTAAALLDLGAEIELRDSAGETPLRRAVNCGKVAVAAFLLERGADRYSVGSKGLRAMQAARSADMKKLFA